MSAATASPQKIAGDAGERIGGLLTLDVALIDPDPKNRKEHDKDQLQSLAATIAKEGLLQPILVRLHPTKPGRYMIEAGERRWRAHLLNKAKTISARLVKSETEVGAATKRAIENFQREDLNAIDEARLFRELTVDHKLSQTDVAKIAGKQNPSYVSNSLRILDCPADVQKLIESGDLTRAHGIALARWSKWPKVCIAIAGWAVKKGLPARLLETETLPVSYELVNAGIVSEIESWDYTLPAAFKSDPDFIAMGNGGGWYCLVPAKWEQEQVRQDKARAAARAKAAAKSSKATTTDAKHSEKVAAERREVIERNKKRRADLKNQLATVFKGLAKSKVVTSHEVAILASEAIAGGYHSGWLREVADMLGMKVPAGVISSGGGQGLGSAKVMVKMDPADIAKLAVGVILHKQVDDACKNGAGYTPVALNLYSKGGK